MTVSYNEQVAHCFRCQWKTNRYQLAKQLGVITKELTPAERVALAREQVQAVRAARLEKSFQAWRDRQTKTVIERLRNLRTTERYAHQFPDEEESWEALSLMYHNQAQLFSRFDFLQCARTSQWLENDSTLENVIDQWRNERRKNT